LVQKKLILIKLEDWAKQFGIARDLWHVWDSGLSFTKVGSSVPISALVEDAGTASIDHDKTEQAVRVLDTHTKKSLPIMNIRRSLMSVLADRALYSLRIYVILAADREQDREKIQAQIRKDVIELDWL